MKEKLKQLMAEVFEIDPRQVMEDATINNLEGWDSLNHLRLVAAIEGQFHVKLSQDDIVRMISFQKIVSILGSRV